MTSQILSRMEFCGRKIRTAPAKSVDSECTVSTKSSASTVASLDSLQLGGSKAVARRKKMQAQEELLDLLSELGFGGGVNSPHEDVGRVFFVFKAEVIYPIHFAAKQGDVRLVRQLLAAGADPLQKTSRGRTALQIAKKCNRKGSHTEVEELLGGDLQIVSFRGFRRLAKGVGKEAWMP
ncbi:hypothetical protein AK812_SmicGene6246 [Symbiodinium microadriaticum]|uniref:Uncharacterized protein n=1 Tax=Symbiodinium microadriaticum TaxID=2951 RepID=A0A1Q9ERU1_SYMMI|nr:hypothetical protein AK812_SmicGene6246 [Symbiodinium microadriaticum]